jgi:hypothetical protein
MTDNVESFSNTDPAQNLSNCASVTNFVRSPLWILPTIGSGTNETISAQIERYRDVPGELTKRRKYNESVMNSIYCKISPVSMSDFNHR